MDDDGRHESNHYRQQNGRCNEGRQVHNLNALGHQAKPHHQKEDREQQQQLSSIPNDIGEDMPQNNQQDDQRCPGGNGSAGIQLVVHLVFLQQPQAAQHGELVGTCTPLASNNNALALLVDNGLNGFHRRFFSCVRLFLVHHHIGHNNGAQYRQHHILQQANAGFIANDLHDAVDRDAFLALGHMALHGIFDGAAQRGNELIILRLCRVHQGGQLIIPQGNQRQHIVCVG